MPVPTDMRVVCTRDGVWMAQDRTTGYVVAVDEGGDLRVRFGDKPTVGAMRVFAWVLGCVLASDEVIRNNEPPFKA